MASARTTTCKDCHFIGERSGSRFYIHLAPGGRFAPLLIRVDMLGHENTLRARDAEYDNALAMAMDAGFIPLEYMI